MANHKSALKRIRSNDKKRCATVFSTKRAKCNRKKLELPLKKRQLNCFLSCFLIDKLAKKNIIHANKAANLKSKLGKTVASFIEF